MSRQIKKAHQMLAKDIVSYAFSARACHIPEGDIERVIAGYLEQMEIAIRGAMELEKMPRLHPLQISEFLSGEPIFKAKP
jgi:hypothetical protein